MKNGRKEMNDLQKIKSIHINIRTLKDHVMHEKAIRDFVIKIVSPTRPIAACLAAWLPDLTVCLQISLRP